MKTGTIIEYIDQQKILCAVVMEVKNKRLRLLTESDREVNLALSRVSFISNSFIDITSGRNNIVNLLKSTTLRREKLKESINLKELWELLCNESDWIDLATMAEYCFPGPPESDQQAAVIRSCFENRLYFKFDHDRFLPHSEEHVEKYLLKKEQDAKKQIMIEKGAEWLKKAVTLPEPVLPDDMKVILEILKSCYIYEKESPHYKTGKEILAKSGLGLGSAVLNLLVRLGELSEDDNLDLYRLKIPLSFSDDVLQKAKEIQAIEQSTTSYSDKEDYTYLSAITIDGSATTDYDDALSIEKIGDSYVLGIHISDVSFFIQKDDLLDRKALARGASIYMPEQKIPMLPKDLSEDTCSLIKDRLRPCISVVVTLSKYFEIKDYEVVSTQIKVDRQLTYSEAEKLAESDNEVSVLIRIAKAFREKRLNSGATQITLPEVNAFFDDDGVISISTIDRESPPRMMVAEMMIMANWLMAGFISRHELPAVFRSQPEPKERLYRGASDSIAKNCLQRKYINRAIISNTSAHHSGLGVDAYTTATSPIRRYYDLIAQRQIKAALGLGEAYTVSEITRLIQTLELPMGNVGKIQFKRKRYWILKYLESKIGTRTQAVVLNKRKNSYNIILTEYMIEYFLPASGLILKPQDLITVVIQHSNPKKDSFSVYIG